MQQYLDLLRRILDEGEDVATGAFLPKENRHPHARCLIGVQYRHDLRGGFPAVTTKKLFWKGVVAELLWFLRGDTSLDFLHDHNVHIWDQWRNERNEVAYVYPMQWRHWPYPADSVDPTFPEVMTDEWDQVATLVAGLKAVAADPADRARRRLLLSAWNPPYVPRMGLAPCHSMASFLPTNGVLHTVCHWRSIDMLLGFPFNVSSYALLTHLLASVTGLEVGTLTANIADCHLYDNQFAAVREQLSRAPHEPPVLQIDSRVRDLSPDLSIEQCKLLDPSMFKLVGYESHPKLSSEVEIAE